MLRVVNPSTNPIFARVNADGTTDSMEFDVPDGRRLVITDVDWTTGPTSPATADAKTIHLFLESKADSKQRSLVFASTANSVEATFNDTGRAGSSSDMTSGFVLTPAARLVAGQSSTGTPTLDTNHVV